MLACRDEADVHVVFEEICRSQEADKKATRWGQKRSETAITGMKMDYELLHNTPSPSVVNLCFSPACLMLDNNMWRNCTLQSMRMALKELFINVHGKEPHLVSHLCCDGSVGCQAVAGAYWQCMLSSGNFAAEVQRNAGVARQEFYPDFKQEESCFFSVVRRP